jgi:hypothetical protein
MSELAHTFFGIFELIILRPVDETIQIFILRLEDNYTLIGTLNWLRPSLISPWLLVAEFRG